MKLVTRISFLLIIPKLILLPISCTESKIKNDEKVIKDDCVKIIIATDDSLGSIRNEDCREITLSQTIINYTTSLEALDFSDCPKPFSDAFQEHILAWKNILVETDNYPSLRGEMHDIFDQIKQGPDSTKFNLLLNKIWETWSKVEEAMKK